MKRKNGLFCLLPIACCLVCFFNSCKEVGPYISLNVNPNLVSDTSYLETTVQAAQQKNVVMEEFTGVRCPNCPQGHVIIANIKAANPDRIVAVSLHPINSLGAPYPYSAEDFRNSTAQNLFDFLGQIGLEPAASIDRKLFAGQSALLMDKSGWDGHVSERLNEVTPVNIVLDNSYDNNTRELTVFAEVHYTKAVAEPNKITVLLTESGMVSAQLNGSVIDTFYTHRDIMRTFVSVIQGDRLTGNLEPGRVFRNEYKVKLNASWKPENMKIVAFVHEYQNSKVIYQGKEKGIE